MTRHSTIVQVFVASPSDVEAEREMLGAVIVELNRVWSQSLGVSFELIRWETNTYPAMGRDVQDIINYQIGDDYDIFIGILWSRFGTPTPRALSGTEEEFKRAIARIRDGRPDIMIYFKDAPISPSKIDPEQLVRVNEFKASISGMSLYSTFGDGASFQASLRAHLTAIGQKYAQNLDRTGSDTQHMTQSVELGDPSPLDDDLGFFDYIDIFQLRSSEMTNIIKTIVAATVNITNQITSRAEAIQQVNDNNKNDRLMPKESEVSVRRVVSLVSEYMSVYADTLEINLPLLTSSRIAAMEALANGLALSQEISQSKSDIMALKPALQDMLSGITQAATQLDQFRTGVAGLPRLLSKLNKARRNLIAQLDLLIVEFNSTSKTVRNILHSIEVMT